MFFFKTLPESKLLKATEINPYTILCGSYWLLNGKAACNCRTALKSMVTYKL